MAAIDQQDSRRESIWSIRQLSLTRYYIAFAIFFALTTGFHLWRGFATALPGTHYVDTVLAALKEASGLIPWLIVFTFYLVEGVSMLAERYLRSRYAKGRQEGREEGRVEVQQEWLAWNLRREEAMREGKEFGRQGKTRGPGGRKTEGREEAREAGREEALRKGREFAEPPQVTRKTENCSSLQYLEIYISNSGDNRPG